MKNVLMVLALLGLVACNTMDGMGQDIESGGEKLSEKSNEVQNDM